MAARDEIDRAFDEEITALDAFFDRRPREGALNLGRQDPDMRRILEAVAFFSARTRVLAQRNVRETVERLARGQLDYLLTPVPAAGLVRATLNHGLSASQLIPRGAVLRVVTPDRTVGVFTTTRALALLPFKMSKMERDGAAMVLSLEAWIPLRGALPTIPFHLTRNGSYRDSIRLLSALRSSLRGVRVVFDDDEDASPALWSFGGPDAAAGARDDDGIHPIERLRSFFHRPEQELYFNITFPTRATRWTSARIYLDLDPEAPQELLRAGVESFVPFVVPVVNVRRGEAEPILCDGTKDAYPLRDARPPLGDAGRESLTALASVDGVFRVEGAARLPIPPGILADVDPVYTLLLAPPGAEGERDQIAISMPWAFPLGCKVIVDARWHQPSFASHATGHLKISFQARKVDGAELSLLGDLEPPRSSDLWEDPFAVLHALALKTRARLTRDELVSLLRDAGADRTSQYKRLPDLVKEVLVEARVPPGGGAVQQIYKLVWKIDDPDFDDFEEDGMVREFEERVALFLDAWIADETALDRHGAKKAPGLRLGAGGPS
jgi:type VI secretion system protein ImpG